MIPQQLYVLGFAFTPQDSVILIQKKRPAWQAGKAQWRRRQGGRKRRRHLGHASRIP